jgi:hypothetical protein
MSYTQITGGAKGRADWKRILTTDYTDFLFEISVFVSVVRSYS